VKRILFEGSQLSDSIKTTLTQKYFNKLYELIEQQNNIKVITAPMDLDDIKIDSNIVNDETKCWYS
jgi:ABC-type transporter MlaC component